MECLGGGGVWCSRTYAYLSSATTSPFYQFQTLVYTGGVYTVIATLNTDAAMTGGA